MRWDEMWYHDVGSISTSRMLLHHLSILRHDWPSQNIHSPAGLVCRIAQITLGEHQLVVVGDPKAPISVPLWALWGWEFPMWAIYIVVGCGWRGGRSNCVCVCVCVLECGCVATGSGLNWLRLETGRAKKRARNHHFEPQEAAKFASKTQLDETISTKSTWAFALLFVDV